MNAARVPSADAQQAREETAQSRERARRAELASHVIACRGGAASVKKRRLLTGLTASCTPADANGQREVRIVAELVGGDGQDTSSVSSDPSLTDVLVELRVDPAPASATTPRH